MSFHQSWAALAGALLFSAAGCASDPSTSSSSTSPTSSSSSGTTEAVCTPGMDQTCNDDPAISSLHGACQPDGTCVCQAEFAKNEATGRCK